MINVFQLSYEARLNDWYDLRVRLEDSSLEEKCVEIDKWWQKAPLVTHHLHPQDTDNWPDPWQLLSENIYCDVARGLGILYTIALLDRADLQHAELVLTDSGHNLVLANKEKYILNWERGSIVNTNQDISIKRRFTQHQAFQQYN